MEDIYNSNKKNKLKEYISLKNHKNKIKKYMPWEILQKTK